VKREPNVILITIDTLRPDHLGCYGYTHAETPNIDGLANQGLVFEQAITNGSYTKTAFPAILSSTHASMYGGPFTAIGERRPMLAALLKARGYSTAGFTSNPLLGAHIGYDVGFDLFEEPVPAAEARRWLGWKGTRWLLRSPIVNTSLMRLRVDTAPHPVYVSGDEITDRACAWVAGQRGKFLLWVHYMDAHFPYHIPGTLNTGKSRAEAWRDLNDLWKSRGSLPDDGFIQRLKRLYDEGIAYSDQQIGRLLRCLDRGGSAANTMVILTSDHGEAFYEHGRWQHGAFFFFYDEVLRIPLIVKLPGQTSPQRIPQQVCTFGLAPTVLDLLQIPIDPRMEGRSLLPLVRGEAGLEASPVITEMIDTKGWYCASLRTPEFKYVYDERRPEQRDVYDLEVDPGETRNVYGMYPDVEARFESVLRQHLERIGGEKSRDETGGWEHSDEVVRRLRALGYIE
jgi:arylsulfatase A-like enzyme